MVKRSRTEQWQIVIITIMVLLILGFNNVIAFFENLKQTQFFSFLNLLPQKWFYLFVLLTLIFILFENKRFAEKLAGKL